METGDAEKVAMLCDQLGYPSPADSVRNRFRIISADAAHQVFVFETDHGKVGGWIHVASHRLLSAEPFAEIVGLVVDNAQRHQGIGRKLLETAERWARERGHREVRLRSSVTRADAREFYLSQGFTIMATSYLFRKDLRSPDVSSSTPNE